MALCRYKKGELSPQWGWIAEGRVFPLQDADVMRVLVSPGAAGLNDLEARAMQSAAEAFSWAELESGTGGATLAAPVVDGQEVWAAGVTYESSKLARMAESEGGSNFYAKVYTAERPELFFKATPSRVVGANASVRIRADSKWNVPEPELTALLAANGQILGCTIGNDMSSRDIEGENPLYLPQAKVYRGSCALGPVIVPVDRLDPQNLTIRLTIARGGATAFDAETSAARMRRTVADIAQWLFRENEFPKGALLLTGTGLIPPDDFTLHPGDEITIAISGIGALRNQVAANS